MLDYLKLCLKTNCASYLNHSFVIEFCSPSHALYFAAYEAAKHVYGGNEQGHQPLATAAAGMIFFSHSFLQIRTHGNQRNMIFNLRSIF